jgi:hypothetical protein
MGSYVTQHLNEILVPIGIAVTRWTEGPPGYYTVYWIGHTGRPSSWQSPKVKDQHELKAQFLKFILSRS